jgi:hypothetical protein
MLYGRNAYFDCSGGLGHPSGGGGGGGIIFLDNLQNSQSSLLDWSQPKLSVLGGAGMFSNGSEGIISSNPPCGPGFSSYKASENDTFSSSLICQPCMPGNFKFESESHLSCKKCNIGRYSEKIGCNLCPACEVGKYNTDTGLTACSGCFEGTYTNFSGSSYCAKCSAGKYSNFMSDVCTLCSPGSFSTEGASSCLQCEFGLSSYEGSQICFPCNNLPENSFFSKQGFCNYVCDAGFVYPTCETPWQILRKCNLMI